MITACSGQGDLAGNHANQDKRRVYGEQDKRIAQLLSIGETSAKAGGVPQDQALLCDIALQTMSDKLRQSGALSDVQMRAFEKVQAFYRQRAAEGRSQKQIVSARKDLETAHVEASERVRLAIGCLRDLNS
ncbi:MAG: hypothetical protein CMN72_11995 [Sphingomonas sp.]|nr:hypothetical protein [Sphingomonas sp.]GGP00264.1 hypothetical protein GCM10011329_35740 [Stakelama pacifica]|tara:strand:+ start:1307 stop:1699 length:393 start_codon:yes stop_codon:yes gene_type:complete